MSDRGTAGSNPPASPSVITHRVTAIPSAVHWARVPEAPKSTSSGWAVTTRTRSMSASGRGSATGAPSAGSRPGGRSGVRRSGDLLRAMVGRRLQCGFLAAERTHDAFDDATLPVAGAPGASGGAGDPRFRSRSSPRRTPHRPSRTRRASHGDRGLRPLRGPAVLQPGEPPWRHEAGRGHPGHLRQRRVHRHRPELLLLHVRAQRGPGASTGWSTPPRRPGRTRPTPSSTGCWRPTSTATSTRWPADSASCTSSSTGGSGVPTTRAGDPTAARTRTPTTSTSA